MECDLEDYHLSHTLTITLTTDSFTVVFRLKDDAKNVPSREATRFVCGKEEHEG